MAKTSIQWTDHSINPFRATNKETGQSGHFCVKVSPGCKFCYSSRMQSRFGTFPFVVENRPKVDLWLDESKLEDVLRRRVPTKYFWCDMSDMFLEDYPDEWIDRCLAVMALTPWHTHQVLTKRAERMLKYFSENGGLEARRRVQDVIQPAGSRGINKEAMRLNVWLGVSVEDQQRKDRIETLRQTPAAIRFLSIEPLLEDIGELDLFGIHQVIVGGESGPNARPFRLAWARSIQNQCQRVGVSYFFKQAGSNSDLVDWTERQPRDSHGGDPEEWPEEFRVRQFPR